MKEPTVLLRLSLLLGFLCLYSSADSNGPVVQTKLGSLRGQYVAVKGKETLVQAYLGVPFAKAPVGPLRLAPPQTVERWEGVRDATQQPLMCLQDRQIMKDLFSNISFKVEFPEVSEDCLYLNIYTPVKPVENTKLPVMVWIHGGGFTMGSASIADGSALAAYQDVVVVLIQYRLGLMGFFSTGDKHAPGNMGLLDQVEALRWTQDHIHNFGGDSKSVTIFGESAGGMSVSLLLLSPLSAGLFHRAIAESGTAAMDGIFQTNPLPAAQAVANLLGCDTTNTEKIADCVKKLTVNDIVNIHKQFPMLSLGVSVDGQFLPKSPMEILRNHEMHKVPFITGATDDEGGWLLAKFFAPPGWEDGLDRVNVMPVLSMLYTESKDQWITELIADEYMGTSGNRLKNRDGFTKLVGDIMFVIPALKTANFHRDAGVPVYLYEFQQSPSVFKKLRPSFVGTDHADELLFVFGFCLTTSHLKIDDPCTEEDEQLTRVMMRYWGNFARTGSPNGPGLVSWPQYGPEGDYLGIGLEQIPGQHLKRDRFTFMTQTIPEKLLLGREKIEHDELPKTGPVVRTTLGGLRGQYVAVKGKETLVQAYLGVPFAKAPVGPLRLAPPQTVERWEGVRDATQQPLMCLQDRQIMKDLYTYISVKAEFPEVSEDCLYLNIYTPVKPVENTKLPVMVWIHGGGFTMGSASIYDGSALAAYQDVVVVLIQYRLGLMGFFSTGDKHAPGNMGLLDQVEALRWTQDHIHNFGGDSKSVTIFGESAGGVSVSLQLLSPLSAGLFHRAIAESGTAAMDVIFQTNPLPAAQAVANLLGCDTTNTEKIADCVKKLTVNDIVNIHKQFPMLSLGVSVDGQFLPKSPMEILRNHEMHKVPFITGATDDEGGWLLAKFFAPPGWEDGLDRVNVMPVLSMLYTESKDQWITELIADEYMGTSGNRLKNRDGFTKLVGDIMFVIPALKTANFHRDAGVPVYLYEFQQSLSVFKKLKPSFVGTDHGDELVFVLGFCLTTSHLKMDDPCTEEDEQLTRVMMRYWGNFARTGSPNGPGLVPWPQYGPEGDYLGIGLEQIPGQHLKRDRFTFMTQTIPEKLLLGREKIEHDELPKTGPVVQTKLGGLRGQYVAVKGKETLVQAYLGVPFAKAPVGPLRLAPPQTVERWEGVRDATQQPLMCLQDRQFAVALATHLSVGIEIPLVSEDCLYLNIYTPAKPAENTNLPVMVWIHGGGFTIGSASIADGSALAAYQDVVVVLIQYRLGMMGFFSTGDKHAPGNMGLLDQVEALRWTQDHIHNFGGDSKSVTIFGESAGGVSVSLLLHSPLSAGLFHRAIAESGTAAMDFLVRPPTMSDAQMLGQTLECNSTNTEQILDCVMKLTANDILNIQKQNPLMRFGVSVDGHFLTKSLKESFHNHEMHKVPFLTGTNTDESGWALPNAMLPSGWADGVDRDQVMPLLTIFYPDAKDQWIHEVLADEYMGTSEDRIKNRDGFTELIGDALFTIPALKTAGFHRDAGAAVYLYEFQHTVSMLKNKRPDYVKSDHGDEIAFVLGLCFTTSHVTMQDPCTEEDEQLCRVMMRYWGNFARTGSPNGPGLVPWPEYGPEGDYLGIGLEQIPGRHLKRDRFTFMTQTIHEKRKIIHSEL
ncbi:hypothetical protein DPEC_G00164640 [Dallia pectoralis]|uniref:Uncharacterized protein n=1 Tax=Dallia pectoralis TaxID=75939 RepID=A0ACC2GGX3_DALPE|nr:hypothetical protein DPEC_G00164640 [Dallia pectoralis]